MIKHDAGKEEQGSGGGLSLFRGKIKGSGGSFLLIIISIENKSKDFPLDERLVYIEKIRKYKINYINHIKYYSFITHNSST